jgi:hypothetical protein
VQPSPWRAIVTSASAAVARLWKLVEIFRDIVIKIALRGEGMKIVLEELDLEMVVRYTKGGQKQCAL